MNGDGNVIIAVLAVGGLAYICGFIRGVVKGWEQRGRREAQGETKEGSQAIRSGGRA